MTRKIAKYRVHPVANAFPLLEGNAFTELVADIKTHGLLQPVVLYKGKILDGRNRARACQRAKVPIKTLTYKGKDPHSYAVSLNLARRHLNESQRAMVAARLATLQQGSNQHAPNGAPSQKKASTLLSTSRREVQRARKVLEKATPELVAAVEGGHVAVSAAEKVLKRPKRDQVRVAKAGLEAPKVIRDLNRRDREKKLTQISKGNKPLRTAKQYGIILADPSWQYKEGTTTPNRKIENQYPTMPLEEIKALPIPKLSLDNAVLYLWVPAPLLPEGLEVMDAWGFNYKSQWVWEKVSNRPGTGYWAIVEHELVLIGARGDAPPPAPKNRFRSLFKAPVGDHSHKPLEVHKRIEKSYAKATKIELFARQTRKGWDRWGNEV